MALHRTVVDDLIRVVGKGDPHNFINAWSDTKVTEYEDIHLGCFSEHWVNAAITNRPDIMHGWELHGNELQGAVCSGAATFHYVKTREDFYGIENMFQNADSICPKKDSLLSLQQKYQKLISLDHIGVYKPGQREPVYIF